VTEDEMEKIDKEHYNILRKVFEQRDNTPYYGIIAERGLWPYSCYYL